MKTLTIKTQLPNYLRKGSLENRSYLDIPFYNTISQLRILFLDVEHIHILNLISKYVRYPNFSSRAPKTEKVSF